MDQHLLDFQVNYEKRFNCIVCMEAKLHMVYGLCQHRLCSDCLYFDNGSQRPKMDKCPVCAMSCAFPVVRPDIPEDNINLQRCLGVRVCPNQDKGCVYEMWEWEIEEHLRICQFEQVHSLPETCGHRNRLSKHRSKTQSCKRRAKEKRGKAQTSKHQPSATRQTRSARSRRT